MARPSGVRNQDFEAKKKKLLSKLASYLLRDGVDGPSFRQLAIAAETSEPTLRHYFTNRSGLIVEVLEFIISYSEPFRDAVRQPQDSCEEAVMGYLDMTRGLSRNEQYSRAHALGIRESMADEAVQKVYLKQYVGEGIDAVAERLIRSKGGPDTFATARHAAMMLVSSALTIVIHQEVLNGKDHAPIDEDDYREKIGRWMVEGLRIMGDC
jgi:AcrR family transcriptional regulator